MFNEHADTSWLAHLTKQQLAELIGYPGEDDVRECLMCGAPQDRYHCTSTGSTHTTTDNWTGRADNQPID